jgi:hypothetical protein
MLDIICNLLSNLFFWSAISGLIGTILIFFYGLPSKINEDGHINLILEQEDKKAKENSKKYKIFSYFGLSLIALSFLIQIINIILNLEQL